MVENPIVIWISVCNQSTEFLLYGVALCDCYSIIKREVKCCVQFIPARKKSRRLREITAMHYRTAMQYIKDSWKPSVDPIFRLRVYICGAPRSGKSFFAHELCKLGRRDSITSFSAAGQMIGALDKSDIPFFDLIYLTVFHIIGHLSIYF